MHVLYPYFPDLHDFHPFLLKVPRWLWEHAFYFVVEVKYLCNKWNQSFWLRSVWKDPHPVRYCGGHLLKIFCRKKSVWDTEKTELKIEIKRLACGKYLSRYPNISTVCLVAFVVSSNFFSSLLSQCDFVLKLFKCKWKIVRRMPSETFLLNYQRIEKQSIFDIQNEISVTKIRMQNGLFVYLNTEIVSVNSLMVNCVCESVFLVADEALIILIWKRMRLTVALFGIGRELCEIMECNLINLSILRSGVLYPFLYIRTKVFAEKMQTFWLSHIHDYNAIDLLAQNSSKNDTKKTIMD